MDSGVGRTTALTDTMIVASLDPVGKTISMISIPRDMVDVPLPDGRKYRGKINSLVSYVRWHPGKFPGSKGDGQSVLAAALGTLLNLKIDYWAQVNLGGFVYLVDSVGGVNINVTDGFCDYRYKEYGIKGFNITPGRYHMDGEAALAYARVRKPLGESDFTRAARQQEVLGALRDRLVRGGFLDNPSRFLRSLGQTITTNIRPSVIADEIALASDIGRKNVFRYVIEHPLVGSGYDARGSIQVPHVKQIRKLAADLFTPTGVRPKGFDIDARSRRRPDPQPLEVVDVRHPPEAQADREADEDAQADRQAHQAAEGDARADAGADALDRGRVAVQPLTWRSKSPIPASSSWWGPPDPARARSPRGTSRPTRSSRRTRSVG